MIRMHTEKHSHQFLNHLIFLNIICFTSITQKAQVLECTGADVMWSNVIEETGEPLENHRT